jgi:hypothetical protein
MAIYWYYSGPTRQISNTGCIYKCTLYYNNGKAIQNLPLNSTSVVPTLKIQRTAILTLILLTWNIRWAPNNASKLQMGFHSVFTGLFLERLGLPATPLIAISIVQMRIIVVACKRDMDMCFWSIIFPNFTCLHKRVEYLSPSETQARCSRHYHVFIRKLQITRLGLPWRAQFSCHISWKLISFFKSWYA